MELKITENYHTHTFRCKHATGEITDYAKFAVKNNMKVLGISDHSPFPDRRWSKARMDIDDLDNYDNAFKTAAEKYPQLKLLKSMEVDWTEEYKNFYIEEFKYKRNYDYLIGSVHYFLCNGEWFFAFSDDANGKLKEYTDAVIKMIESEIFDFIAHPDLFGMFITTWDSQAISVSKAICEAAKTFKIPLEINGGGFRRGLKNTQDGIRYLYPLEQFWEIAADTGIEAICNSDAHTPEDVIDCMDLCTGLAKKFNLKQVKFNAAEKSGVNKKFTS